MRNDTRQKFTEYLGQVASLNGVPAATVKFTAAPSVQQTLETKIQESSDFLGRVNLIGVTEQSGEKIGLGVSGPVAGTTNTTTTDRAPSNIVTLDDQGYTCTQTNFDTFITYGQLDAWAKFPDFQTRIRDAILKRQALDRIMIGFNGTSRAATSNKTTNPLLQDVNKGWLQYLRDNAPERVMARGATAGKVVVGATGDYKTLDGLVYDATESLLDAWHAEAGDLVAIVGRGLMHDKLFPLVDGQTAPTEMLAADIVRSQRRLGGKQGITVPFMKPNAILITSLKNLSIYYQDGSRRRAVIDNPKRDRIETYESSNDAFVVEDLGKACLIENIELQD